MGKKKTLLKTPLFRALSSSAFVFAIALIIKFAWSINSGNFATGMASIDNSPSKTVFLNILAIIIFIAVVTIFIKLRFSLEGREESLARKADRLIKEEHRVKRDIELLMDNALILSLKYHDRDVVTARKILKGEMGRPLEDVSDIKIVLQALDGLLGKLPAEEVEKFSKTKYAELYKKLLEKYGVK